MIEVERDRVILGGGDRDPTVVDTLVHDSTLQLGEIPIAARLAVLQLETFVPTFNTVERYVEFGAVTVSRRRKFSIFREISTRKLNDRRLPVVIVRQTVAAIFVRGFRHEFIL